MCWPFGRLTPTPRAGSTETAVSARGPAHLSPTRCAPHHHPPPNPAHPPTPNAAQSRPCPGTPRCASCWRTSRSGASSCRSRAACPRRATTSAARTPPTTSTTILSRLQVRFASWPLFCIARAHARTRFPAEGDCGQGIECGEYVFNHRNESLRPFLLGEYFFGETGAANPAVGGFYVSLSPGCFCECRPSPPPSQPIVTTQIGGRRLERLGAL